MANNADEQGDVFWLYVDELALLCLGLGKLGHLDLKLTLESGS